MATDKTHAVYGIDLGTTFSCVAQVDKYDQPIVLRNFEGESTTPSVVYFNNEDDIVVGREAKAMLTSEPEKTVSFIKRQMGVDEAFDKSSNTTPYHFDPSEISAMILKKIVKDANDLGDNPTPIKDVVITCPAYFGNKEKLQTKQAGIIAGLNVLAIINEPTAAAIAYGVKLNERKTILVYDLGGGTFDVTMIVVNGGAIKVVATGGDHHLGGVDWDTLLAEHMLNVFNEQNGTSYSLDDDNLLKYTLLLEAEARKYALTAHEKTKANIQWQGQSATFEITREFFNNLTADKLQETIDATNKVIEIARNKGYENIDEIILVGGSSKMPQVKERISQEFGLPTRLSDPDECVAKGAAIYAMNEAYRKAYEDWKNDEGEKPIDIVHGPKTQIVDVTSKTYGLGLIDNKVGNIIFANTSLPVERVKTFETSKENQRGITLPIYESDYTDEEKDETVDEKFCTLATEEVSVLRLTKDWPKGTPVQVAFKIDKEGILHVKASVEGDEIDFELKITGVKSSEELLAAKDVIDRLSIE